MRRYCYGAEVLQKIICAVRMCSRRSQHKLGRSTLVVPEGFLSFRGSATSTFLLLLRFFFIFNFLQGSILSWLEFGLILRSPKSAPAFNHSFVQFIGSHNGLFEEDDRSFRNSTR